MTQIAIISDTHIPMRGGALPAEAVTHLKQADLIIHAGDLVDIGALEELKALGPPIHAVLGNNDHELEGLLPITASIEVEGVRLGVIHDGGPSSGRMVRLRREFEGHDAVIFGHSHVPLHEIDSESGFQIFNPGSLMDRRNRWPAHTLGIAEVSDRTITFRLVELRDS